MSQIKLTADSGGGTTSFKAPSSTTSNADVVLKLPVADGSSGQVLKTDGSGQLSFTSNAGTTINNQADNRLITCTGTTGTLNGESSLTWDGSAMGVGLSSPTDTLHVFHSTDNLVARFESGDTGGGITLKDNTHVTSLLTTNGAFEINVDQGGDITGETIAFKMSGSEKMRIDSSGKVGIGLTNPVNNLDVSGSVSATGNMLNTAYADGVYIGTNGGLPAVTAGKASNSAYSPLVFRQDHQAAGAERMRIDTNGILLVGATSAVGGGTAIEARHDSNSQQGRIMANGFMARNNYGTPTNITNGMYSPNDKVLAFATDSKERLRFTDKGELEIGNHLNSGNILKQITRASGNTSETITASQLGLDDNNYAVIWVVISGPNLWDWGHSLFSWRMPRGGNSGIITQIDSMASGSSISLFTQAVSTNSLVIQKDSDCELNVTVIGGGGRRSVIGW